MKKFFASAFCSNFGIPLALVLVAIGLFVGTSIANRQWTRELGELDAEINELSISSESNNDIQKDITNRVDKDVVPAGYESGRKIVDDGIASDIFKYATTWSSSQTYESQRDHLLNKYEFLDENSQFLREFFPAVDRVVVRDASGEIVSNPLDDGRNIQFTDLQTFVMDVKGTVYSYFAQINIVSSGYGGKGTSSGQLIATYDVDDQGVVSNIQCYVLTN